MKQIISLGKGKFLTVDCYGENRETRRWNLFIGAIALLISSFTIGAMLGIDITSPNSNPTHETIRRSNG